MTEPTTPNPIGLLPKLTTQAVVLILTLAFLVVALVAFLVWISGPDGRESTLSWLSSIFALIAGGGSLAGVVQNRRIHATVAKVDAQTNGVLDARITAGVTKALAAAGLPAQLGEVVDFKPGGTD